jgi:hypothetical protein
VVLKSPELTGSFPLLAAWLPRARFVMSLRDPRDTIASMLDVAERHRSEDVRSALTEAGRDMARLTGLYTSYYSSCFAGLGGMEGRIFVLRYEDLVREPQPILDALSTFTGLKISAEALTGEHPESGYFNEQQRKKSAFFDGFWSPLYKQGLSAKRVGRYQDLLSPAEISAIQHHGATFNRLVPYW